MNKNKSLLPAKCICNRYPEGAFEHRIGFVGGIMTHVIIDTFIVINLIAFLVSGTIEQPIVFFAAVWLLFWLGWFIVNYFEFRKKGHTPECSKRYAMLMLIFIRR